MNRTIKLLLIADVFTTTGFGLIEPILAIYINGTLTGGSLVAAGLASTLFLITKSAVQLPFSRYVDAHDHKIKWLLVGTFIISLVPFLYIYATDVMHWFLAQILYGIGAGLAYPTWLSLWSTHLDKKHEGYEWSLYSTSVGIMMAITATLGAVLAESVGYQWTFISVGFLSLVGCGILLFLEEKAEKKSRPVPWAHYHSHKKANPGDRHG